MLKAILTTFPMYMCLFWAIILLLNRKHNSIDKKILTLYMFVTATLYVCHCAYFNHESTILCYTDSIYSFATASVYPLYFIYIKSLTESREIRWRDYIILVPAIILGVGIAIIYVVMSPSERINYIQNCLYNRSNLDFSTLTIVQHTLHKMVALTVAVQIIPILYLGFRKINSYNKKINDYYSNTDGKTVASIKNLLMFFVITSLFSFIANVVGKEYFVNNAYILSFPSFLFSTLLFSLGYVGYYQKFTILDFTTDTTESNKEESIDTSCMENTGLSAKIIEIIETKQLFLLPNLKVSDITSHLRTNRTYVHQTINNEIGVSFAELINRYRVEHAKKIIEESLAKGEKPYLSDIILQSGFSSESSFYRIFKQFTQMTPKKWIQEQEIKLKRP